MEDKSKNYKVLQTIAKIGKILSKVAFVFSIIGICGCFVGLLSNVFGSSKVFKIGGVTIYGLLADFDAYNVKSISATLVAWLIVCMGEAKRYLQNLQNFIFAMQKPLVHHLHIREPEN